MLTFNADEIHILQMALHHYYTFPPENFKFISCVKSPLGKKSKNTQTHCGPMAELRILHRNQIICQVYDLFNFFNWLFPKALAFLESKDCVWKDNGGSSNRETSLSVPCCCGPKEMRHISGRGCGCRCGYGYGGVSRRERGRLSTTRLVANPVDLFILMPIFMLIRLTLTLISEEKRTSNKKKRCEYLWIM